MPILDDVRAAAQKRLLFLPHAIRQMSRPQRMISSNEVQTVVAQGEVIEDYQNDPRGNNRLIFGLREDGRAVHIVWYPLARGARGTPERRHRPPPTYRY